jgi:DNA transformation protein
MKASPEFVAYLQDLFGKLGPVRVKSMFGGAGVYISELMIGLLDQDETLYLRVDDETKGRFQAAGSHPFVYSMKDGTELEMGYWRIPEEALEAPDEALDWGRLALDAALRKAASKGAKKRRTRGART